MRKKIMALYIILTREKKLSFPTKNSLLLVWHKAKYPLGNTGYNQVFFLFYCRDITLSIPSKTPNIITFFVLFYWRDITLLTNVFFSLSLAWYNSFTWLLRNNEQTGGQSEGQRGWFQEVLVTQIWWSANSLNIKKLHT